MIRTVFTAVGLAALAFGAAAPSFAVGGYKLINTIRNGGSLLTASDSDGAGTTTFFNLPEGPYQIAIDASKLTKPTIVKVQVGRNAPLSSAPILPGRRSAAGSPDVLLSSAAGAPLTFVIPPGSGAPRGAKPKAVAGPAPRDANPLSTIVVTVATDEFGPTTPK